MSGINRLIAKDVDLLQFEKKLVNKKKIRKEPQNIFLDYILVGTVVMAAILLILYFVGLFIL